MNIRTDILWRVYLVYATIFLGASLVCFQLFRVQFVNGTKWKRMADSLSTRFMKVPAIRGNIYADDGSLLATSLPEYELRLDALVLSRDMKLFHEKEDALSTAIATLFRDKSAKSYSQALKRAVARKDRYFLLHSRVPYSSLQLVKQFPIFNTGQYHSGLIAVAGNKRIKPFGSLALRTIGYYTETVRPVGLEGAYRDYLHGTDGRRLVERAGGGIWLPLHTEAEEGPEDGKDIVSTINVNIQDVAQSSLERSLLKSNADHGCVIVMEVATGEIKAISSLTRSGDHYEEKFNYAIGEATEPGSTFKLASYLVALEDGKLDTGTLVDVNGGKTTLYGHRIRDSEEGDHLLTVKQAFEKSSNVAVATLINRLYSKHPEKFTSAIRGLGLSSKLNIQIPGEGEPKIKTPKSADWTSLSLPQMAYGYELKLTPLQMLTFYNAIANAGKMIAPLFVKEINSNGKVLKRFEARVIRDSVCSRVTRRKLCKMLEGVVTQGTAISMSKEPYSIAGKTGTAQVAQGSEGYRLNGVKYQASFCGYFPAENPHYSMIIVLNSPSSGSYYAAQVAGPVFLDIASKIYSTHMDLQKEYAVIDR